MTLFEPGLLKPPGRLLRQGSCEPRSVTERIFSIASDKAISNGVLGLWIRQRKGETSARVEK